MTAVITGRRGDTLWKIALFILVLAGIVWLGSVVTRTVLSGELLKPASLEFEDYIAPDAEREIFRLMSMASIVGLISYGILLISATVFLITSPFRLREHGWLMMSAILLYVWVPVELFTAWLDLKLIYLEFYTAEGRAAFRELFLARAGALSGTPFIAQLSYYTIIALAVFQPLRRTGTIR